MCNLFQKCFRPDSNPRTSSLCGTYVGNRVVRMLSKGRICIFAAKKKKSGVSHPHTGSTGSAAGSLLDSCICIHPPGSDSHADTCGYHHTHPYLSGTNIQQNYCESLCSVINQHILTLLSSVFRPSQVCALGSNENPRWQSQLKLPGVFWQTPLEPHRLGSDAHSLLSTQRRGKRSDEDKTGNLI